MKLTFMNLNAENLKSVFVDEKYIGDVSVFHGLLMFGLVTNPEKAKSNISSLDMQSVFDLLEKNASENEYSGIIVGDYIAQAASLEMGSMGYVKEGRALVKRF